MNIEKLKPWNWFKHEDDFQKQIPVSKTKTEESSSLRAISPSSESGVGSLLRLHQDMERLFDDTWRSLLPLGRSKLRPESSFDLFSHSLGDYRAKLDVSGSDKEYEVSIDLPGLSEDDVQIELKGNALHIKGKKEENKESGDKQYYCIERSIGAFQRTLSLPDDADHNDISAHMKNGVLVIKIPRKALPKEEIRRIEIAS